MLKHTTPSTEWIGPIRSLLDELSLSQADLASRLGVSRATVTRWIKGSHEPTSASYLAMGNLLGHPKGGYFWERAGVDRSNFPDTKLQSTLSSLRVNLRDFTLVSGMKLTRGIVESKSNAVVLPLLNIVAYGDRVPPGPHVTLAQAEVLDVLMAPLSWCAHPEKMLCMQLVGDSMSPLIPPNSVIAVDTGLNDRAQLDKKLAVFSHRDLGFKVARLQRLPASDILISANHTYLPVDVTDQSKWKVVGAVAWWVSKDALPHAAENSKPASGT
ncbi:Helix-turn-helix [Bryocella elongata]|uniref:Helix-turn-helix n=2 Tax=Bryocella elongata TaxID=863522 RepID=A0A1H6C042_9BACT|nr:Helix-turn-helix [Bryocella elongata]